MIRDFLIAIDGIQISVRQIQTNLSSELPSLVFLHEALGSIPQWRNFPLSLSQAVSRNAFIIERQGHGQSTPFHKPRTAHYLQEEALDVLPKIMAHLNLKNPILIGHSDGGTIGLLYAAHFPITAIVSMAAHTFVENITLVGVRSALTQKAFLIDRLQKYHGDKAAALFHAWNDTWLAADFRNWDIREALTQITCPVLAMQGEDDEYGTVKQVESIVEKVSGSVVTCLLKNAGHHPHLRAMDKVVKEIQTFITQLPIKHEFIKKRH